MTSEQRPQPLAVTAEAASNIAFIKYWGALDLERAVPVNPSISMTLSRCRSVCSASFEPDRSDQDEILLVTDGERAPAPPAFRRRISRHLDTLREVADRQGRFRIATSNNFPSAAGIASSASGFAALTIAVTRSLGLEPSDTELSSLARRSGSGSAARSVMGGYVEWPAALASADSEDPSEEECCARSLAPAEHWDLRDVIVIAESGPKEISSREGHRRAPSSPYYEMRQKLLPERLDRVRLAVRERDFGSLGSVVEEEGVDLHLIAMSSRPPIFYWKPPTLAVLERVRELRGEGVLAFSTMDAGANVHVICEPENEEAVATELRAVAGVEKVIQDRVGGPPVWRYGAEL